MWPQIQSLLWPFGARTRVSLSLSSHKAKFGVTAQLSPTPGTDKFSVCIKAGQCHVVIMAWGFEGKIVFKIELSVSVLLQCLENWRQTVLAHSSSSYLHFHSAKPLPNSVFHLLLLLRLLCADRSVLE